MREESACKTSEPSTPHHAQPCSTAADGAPLVSLADSHSRLFRQKCIWCVGSSRAARAATKSSSTKHFHHKKCHHNSTRLETVAEEGRCINSSKTYVCVARDRTGAQIIRGDANVGRGDEGREISTESTSEVRNVLLNHYETSKLMCVELLPIIGLVLNTLEFY